MPAENTRNIVSNDLDQAPKTGQHYEERLQDMSEEIVEIMDQEHVSLEGDDETIEWVFRYGEKIPMSSILKFLNEGENSVTLELQREFNEKYSSVREFVHNKRIGYLSSVESLDLGKVLSQYNTHNNPLRPGEIATLLRFQKTNPEVSSRVGDHLSVRMMQVQKSSPSLRSYGELFVREEKDIDRDSIVL